MPWWQSGIEKRLADYQNLPDHMTQNLELGTIPPLISVTQDPWGQNSLVSGYIELTDGSVLDRYALNKTAIIKCQNDCGSIYELRVH